MSKILSLALVLIVLAPTFIFSVISGHAMIGNNNSTAQQEVCPTGYRGSGRIDTEPKAYRGSGRLEDATKGYRGSGRKGNPDCVLITTTKRLSGSNFSTEGNRTNKPTRKASTKPIVIKRTTQEENCPKGYRGSGRYCILITKSTNPSNKTNSKKVANPDCSQNHSIGGVYIFSDGAYKVTKSERLIEDASSTSGKRCVVEVQHCTNYKTKDINNWAMPVFNREIC